MILCSTLTVYIRFPLPLLTALALGWNNVF